MRASEVSEGNTLPAPFNVVQGGVALAVSAARCCRRAPEGKKVPAIRQCGRDSFCVEK